MKTKQNKTLKIVTSIEVFTYFVYDENDFKYGILKIWLMLVIENVGVLLREPVVVK